MRAIGSAAAEDAEGIFDLLQNFATSYTVSRDSFERDYLRLLDAGDAELLVVRNRGLIVGYLRVG